MGLKTEPVVAPQPATTGATYQPVLMGRSLNNFSCTADWFRPMAWAVRKKGAGGWMLGWRRKMEMTGGFDGPPRGVKVTCWQRHFRHGQEVRNRNLRGVRGSVSGAGVSLQHWGHSPALGSV